LSGIVIPVAPIGKSQFFSKYFKTCFYPHIMTRIQWIILLHTG
jgi:hypothetical protein